MLWLHPSVQLLAILIGSYAAYLGMERFLSQHLNMRTQFLWKRHVKVGQIAIFLWSAGLLGAMSVVHMKWGVNFVTSEHYQIAFIMTPLMVASVASGIYMDKIKAKRKLLPLIHGICNTILIALAFYQIRTGWQVISDYIL